MPGNKTKPTAISVAEFIAAVPDPVRRADAETLVALMGAATGEPATLWGPSIVGFGRYHYHYDSGREGDMARISFSPRKAETALYLAPGITKRPDLLARLGKHRTGQSCLYIKRLVDIDMAVLREMIDETVAYMDAAYPENGPSPSS